MSAVGRLVTAAVVLCAPQAAMAEGACTASISNGVLEVVCDAEDNDITISERAADVFTVTGNDGTTVNGLQMVMLVGAVDDIVVDMRGGDDLSEVAETDIPGSLTVHGGHGRNEFLLAGSSIGTWVDVDNKDNGETDFEESYVAGDIWISNKTGFDECKIDDTEVGGSVFIDNGDGDPLTGEGGATDIESDALVWGDVIIDNKDGFDEFGLEEATIMGTLEINNHDGDMLSGDGSSTEIEDDAFIGGDLILINKDGVDEVDIEEAEIAGNVFIALQAGDTGVDIELAEIGGSITVDAKNGFDAFDLCDTSVGGGVTLTYSAGGSDILMENGISIDGDLVIQTQNGTDTVTLDDTTVDGAIDIYTGPAADYLDVGGSTFSELFQADGQSGFDTYTDNGGNAFNGGFQLFRFEAP